MNVIVSLPKIELKTQKEQKYGILNTIFRVNDFDVAIGNHKDVLFCLVLDFYKVSVL